MKAIVTALAFGAALVATGFIVAVHRDPFFFTSQRGLITKEPLDSPVRVVPVSMAVEIEEPEPAVNPVTTLEQVDIVGRLPPRKRAAAPPREEPPFLEIIEPPCVHGEYRKLEENRGVYLMCPDKPEPKQSP